MLLRLQKRTFLANNYVSQVIQYKVLSYACDMYGTGRIGEICSLLLRAQGESKIWSVHPKLADISTYALFASNAYSPSRKYFLEHDITSYAVLTWGEVEFWCEIWRYLHIAEAAHFGATVLKRKSTRERDQQGDKTHRPRRRQSLPVWSRLDGQISLHFSFTSLLVFRMSFFSHSGWPSVWNEIWLFEDVTVLIVVLSLAKKSWGSLFNLSPLTWLFLRTAPEGPREGIPLEIEGQGGRDCPMKIYGSFFNFCSLRQSHATSWSLVVLPPSPIDLPLITVAPKLAAS